MHISAIRLKQGLPLNGQRTHSNAKTAKKLNASRLVNEKFNKKKNSAFKGNELKEFLAQQLSTNFKYNKKPTAFIKKKNKDYIITKKYNQKKKKK